MARKEHVEEFSQFMAERRAELLDKAGIRKDARTLDAMVRNEALVQSLWHLFKNNPWPKPNLYQGQKTKSAGRILNLMLSDLHYGSDLLATESGVNFGPVEEARRTAAVVLAAADWKRQYRKETNLIVHLIGDIIEGKLHDPENAAPLTEQVFRACWNLGQAFRYLASQFPQVTIYCSPGNHGRRKDRHPDRAVNQKWDSIENMIYGCLKMSLANVPNLKVIIPLTPYYRYEAFDRKGFMTHGDTVINAGYPSQSINVGNIRRQINEINASEHCDLYGVGHVHTASSVRLPSGSTLITNGCLVPSGEYGQSIGMMKTTCCQQIWESVPGIILGHRMEVLVDEKTDKNADLDKIIRPYPGTAEFGMGNG